MKEGSGSNSEFKFIRCCFFLRIIALLLLASSVECYYTISPSLLHTSARVILAYYCGTERHRIRNKYNIIMNVWTADGSRYRESDFHSVERSIESSKKLNGSSSRKEQERDDKKDSRNIFGYNKIRYRARLSYDGTHFYGFQYQSGTKRTVQGEVQKVLSKRFNQPVTVVGASRTDTGVHARGQAIHFDVVDSTYNLTNYSSLTSSSSLLSRIQYSINRMLPLDVRIFSLSITANSHPSSWHAIKSAKCKLYSYRLFSSPRLTDPLQRYTRACIHNAIIDIQKLNHTLSYFVGTHDFRPFSGSLEQTQRSRLKKLRNTSKKALSLPPTTPGTNTNDTYTSGSLPTMIINTTRTIFRIELVKESSLGSHVASNLDDDDRNHTYHNNYRIDFYIQGALYKMIRNIVGAAVEASRVITADQEKNNKRRQVDENDIRRLLQLTTDGDQEQKSKPTTTTTTIRNEALLTRKDNLSKPAPPEGLTLEWVFYDDDYDDNNYESLGCRWRDIESSIIMK